MKCFFIMLNVDFKALLAQKKDVSYIKNPTF